MLRFLADEDFNRAIVLGVRRADPRIDIVRVQDVGLRTQEDTVVLNWAANEGRILLTHDITTMPDQAYERIINNLSMPGVFVVHQDESISRVIEEIILLAQCSLEGGMGWAGELFTALKIVHNRWYFAASYIIYNFAKSESRDFNKSRLTFSLYGCGKEND